MTSQTATDPRPLREAVEYLLVTLLTGPGDRRPDSSPATSVQLRAILTAADDPGDTRSDQARAVAIRALERLTTADLSGARADLITAHRLLLGAEEPAAGKHRSLRAV